MSERGVFAVDRGVFDHPMFAPEPFTEREAWMWMCGAAAWKKTRARIGRAAVTLERGQLAFSLRFMATKWRWPEARVRRFLKRLKTDAMIDTLATHETTQITICNYEKYAFGRRNDECEIDAQNDAPPTHSRRKEEELQEGNKEEIKESASLRSVDREPPNDWPPEAWDQFYGRYPHKVGKAAAVKAFEKARRTTSIPWSSILSALERYIATKPNDRAWCNPATWWNEGRYEDQPAENGVVNAQSKRSVQDAAADLVGRMREFDRPAPGDLRGGTGGAVVKLLPQG